MFEKQTLIYYSAIFIGIIFLMFGNKEYASIRKINPRKAMIYHLVGWFLAIVALFYYLTQFKKP
jgi:multisubunit Na+/H+ antiporter MnhB subunit